MSKTPATKNSGKENQAELNREHTQQQRSLADREKEQPSAPK